ncbi:MAG: DUF4249 domain-containing protein, partial [Bacteroidetes bacterium]|nr:DUF4249 domain-containing protein [Bacteroidota bacterium]
LRQHGFSKREIMLRNNIAIAPFILFVFLWGCEKPFDPKLKGSDARKYVINGGVYAGDSLQRLTISQTSAISNPEYLPVSLCQVIITDDRGNSFTMTDVGNGNYQANIDQAYLIPGTAFKVEINTPDGSRLESDYDTLLPVSTIEAVYYEIEVHEGNNPDDLTPGVQFFLDMQGSSNDSRNYRWSVFETYEYHSMYAREWYYDGEVHHIVPPDSSTMYCWRTVKIAEIFTLTTSNLNENAIVSYPLHFVSNRSVRMEYGYSLLVKQYALSNAAYIYWDQMRQNSLQGGSLYETQPLAIKGNMHHLSTTDQEVLGFFGASQVVSRRIFLTNPGLNLDYNSFCSPTILRKGVREIDSRYFPAFLMGDAMTYYPVWLNDECVDCTLMGGVTVKPDFWPY